VKGETPMAELIEVDPRELRAHEHNLRTRRKDDLAELVAQHPPQRGARATAGDVRPRAGDDSRVHHRGRAPPRRAAVEAELATVPCVVMAAMSHGPLEADTIHAMLGENVARANLTPAEEAAGWLQLSLLGAKVGDIVAATGRKGADVEMGLKLAEAPKATAIAAEYALTLEQAAGLAEFEQDREALKTLTKAATERPDDFPRQLRVARNTRIEREAREALAGPLREKGVTILEGRSGEALTALHNGDGKPLTVAGHKKCPGHAAWVGTLYYGESIKAHYVCTDWRANGHHLSRSEGGKAAESEAEKEAKRAAKARQKLWAAERKRRLEWITERKDRRFTTDEQQAIWRLLLIRATAYSASLGPSSKVERRLVADLMRVSLSEYGYDDKLMRAAIDADAEVVRVKLAFTLMATTAEAMLERYQPLGQSGPHAEPLREWFALLGSLGYASSDVELAALADGAPAEKVSSS
jgi:ParB family transcriptional regulator, chromosome partitioning protein